MSKEILLILPAYKDKNAYQLKLQSHLIAKCCFIECIFNGL